MKLASYKPPVIEWLEFLPAFITQQLLSTEHKRVAVILCTAGLLAIVLTARSTLLTLQAEVANREEAIVCDCYSISSGKRFWETGHPIADCSQGTTLEEQVTQAKADHLKCNFTRSNRDNFTCLDSNGESTGLRTECASIEEQTEEAIEELLGQPIHDTLTPDQEEAVTRQMEGQFGTSKRQAFLSALETSAHRIEKLLASPLPFSPNQRTTLQETYDWLMAKQAQFEEGEPDIRQTRNVMQKRLTAISALVTTVKRQEAANGPRIENLVTRIDALVARVGTTLLELEREGTLVPVEVQTGYERAKRLVRNSKSECSTRRPASCHQLATVLEIIEAMQKPLCALDSSQLSFCSS